MIDAALAPLLAEEVGALAAALSDPAARAAYEELAAASAGLAAAAALSRLDTLVVLMGAARRRSIAALLQAHGRAPATPAAVIENGTLAQERVLTAPLARLADLAEDAALQSPATLVVGDVVQLRDGIRSRPARDIPDFPSSRPAARR